LDVVIELPANLLNVLVIDRYHRRTGILIDPSSGLLSPHLADGDRAVEQNSFWILEVVV
jgi:hypothetical protein